jgi:hypothetical protein
MTYQDKADQLCGLLEEKLGIRGKGLEHKVKNAGRLLPRHVQRKAGVVAEALMMQGSPKMARLVNEAQVNTAFRDCETYLTSVNAWDRKMGKVVGVAASIAFSMIVVAALIVTVLVWRGLI